MKIEKLIVRITLLAALAGCADREVEEPVVTAEDSPVSVSLALSLPDVGAGTRMADPVVQPSYADFRGLKDVRIIPFKVAGRHGLCVVLWPWRQLRAGGQRGHPGQ